MCQNIRRIKSGYEVLSVHFHFSLMAGKIVSKRKNCFDKPLASIYRFTAICGRFSIISCDYLYQLNISSYPQNEQFWLKEQTIKNSWLLLDNGSSLIYSWLPFTGYVGSSTYPSISFLSFSLVVSNFPNKTFCLVKNQIMK